MTLIYCRCAALFLTVALAPLAQASAAPCVAAGAPLVIGTVAAVPANAAQGFGVSLAAGEGVIIDLTGIAAPASGDDEDAAKPRTLGLCSSRGELLAPQPGEVFEKGGSHTNIDEGERLRFVAPSAGQYVVTIASASEPREVLVRRRKVESSQSPVISAALDSAQKGIVSSNAPMVFSFSATAGQWVEIKSTSEKDTLLRIAGPVRAGEYAQLAENDDSEGLNPILRRKLAIAGTYYVQVDSLSDEPGEFELSLNRTAAPKPAPPPAALRAGLPVAGRLADGDAVALYTLPVMAGHSYQLALTAPYDGVLAIGLPNPVEPEDGAEGPDAGFSEVKSQDSNLSGTERLSFTARSTGQLLVRIKSFGIGETDGGYTLTATDEGS